MLSHFLTTVNAYSPSKNAKDRAKEGAEHGAKDGTKCGCER